MNARTLKAIDEMIGPLPPLNTKNLVVRNYGEHLVIEHNHAAVYVSYSGYCDPRLENTQLLNDIIDAMCFPLEAAYMPYYTGKNLKYKECKRTQ